MIDVPSSHQVHTVDALPRDVWLEAVVNAVIHRAYDLGGDHVRVEIFDDRLEVHSPGRFAGVTEVRDPLEIPHFARNHRVARVCRELGFGRELGEGIRRMAAGMRDAGLAPPTIRQFAGRRRGCTLLRGPRCALGPRVHT